jgi:hypothetical protein
MKYFLKIAAFFAITICFSCEGKEWFVNCPDCTAVEPEFALVKVKLKDIQSLVSIKVYEGDLEDDILYSSFDTQGSDYTTKTSLNKKYTFTATYNIGGNTYIAVSSAIPRIRYEENQCENPCYFIYDNIVDLRLKYTAAGK